MLSGCAAFFWFNISKMSFMGTTPIVPSLVISTAAFIIGSYIGRPEDKKILDTFGL